MKLKLIGDEQQERPCCLSTDFFSSFITNQIKRTGTLQLLTYSRKRQGVYSTKFSDGFFIAKVMLVNQAAQQLQKGSIKPMWIVQITLRNHGEGVLIGKQQMQSWPYGKQVGQPIPWKLKKENINSRGSNFILWSTQKMEQLYFNQSQMKLEYNISQTPFKNDQSKIQNSYGKKSKSVNKNSKNKQQYKNARTCETQSLQLNNLQNIPEMQTQKTKSLIENLQKQKTSTPQKINNNQRFASILNLLLSDQTQNQASQPKHLPQKPIILSSDSRKIIQRKKDLQFIFDCLNDPQSSISLQKSDKKSKVPQNILNSQSNHSSQSEDDIFNWITQKSNLNRSNRSLSDSNTFSNTRDKTCQFKTNETTKISQIKQNSNEVKNIYISMEQLSYGYVNKSTVWSTKAFIKCLHMEKDNLLYTIISDYNHGFPIFATFKNTQKISFQLLQNKGYILGKGKLKQSLNNRLNISSIDLQFDCSNCIVQQDHYPQNQIIQPSKNYCSFQKINQSSEDTIVNCFGVLKDFKQLKTKSGGNMYNFQIVDPITKWSMSYTQFQSHMDSQLIKQFINKPITLFNVGIGSYKNKKNLLRKPITLLKHDWLPLTIEANQIRQWLNSSTSLAEIQTELVGYTQINNLLSLIEEGTGRFIIQGVTVLEFKEKYTYKGCAVCFKKVEENKCKNCGPRKIGQVVDRLFLRGQLGDSTTTINVIWSNSCAQSLLSKGFLALKDDWVLARVTVWFDKVNNAFSIVRMRKENIKDALMNNLLQIKTNLL